ncbi:glycosyltransferase [uncultured Winogradskyella sp.]|uniref:glycosyltransferase family 2 protein n=1 Tax=uncultured Winogradskyella sp. TaxID=395353 RepID=UPI0030D73AF0|tara:strand:- start:16284 stop:17237 length:954 start_codon:yes stop_codon:yes gene_type:complete
MISFIIIGKNEERTIKQAINSVLNVIESASINDSDIIYVDSKSSDNTLQIAKSYPQIKCFEITGTCNAAIARNIGATESKGDILCFIDADMELQVEFIQETIKSNKLIYPFISGQLKNYFYNSIEKRSLVGTNNLHKNLTQDKYEATTGGYFLINRVTWFSVNGMRNKYRRCQDIDLGLRLAKNDTKLLRKKELMVNHHTIDYQNKNRMWKMLFDGSLLFMTSVLYRDHIFNSNIYPIILRNSYTLLILIITLLSLPISFLFLFFHPIILFARVLMQNRSANITDMLRRFIYFYLLDLFSLIGFFAFFPKKQPVQYK